MMNKLERQSYAIATAVATDQDYVQIEGQRLFVCPICDGCGLYRGAICKACESRGFWLRRENAVHSPSRKSRRTNLGTD
jgi:hypothetical protein